MYISKNCNWTPYGTDPIFDESVDNVADKHERYDMVLKSYGLDKLINDPSPYIREAVAEQGYGLDILINDKNEYVRKAVAEQGYGLDILAHDNYYVVYSSARRKLEKLGYNNTSDWAKANPDKVHDPDNIISKDTILIKDFIYKVDNSNKLKVQTNLDSIDEFFYEFFDDYSAPNRLDIYTVDTDKLLFTIHQIDVKGKVNYKFIANIKIKDDQGYIIDDFAIASTVKSKEHLNNLIQQITDVLRQCYQFSKYADDLENCMC